MHLCKTDIFSISCTQIGYNFKEKLDFGISVKVHLHFKNVGLHTHHQRTLETSPDTRAEMSAKAATICRLAKCNTKTTRQRKRVTGSKMWSGWSVTVVVWCGVVAKKTNGKAYKADTIHI